MTGACDQPHLTFVSRGTKLGDSEACTSLALELNFLSERPAFYRTKRQAPVMWTHSVTLTGVQTCMAAPLCSMSLAELASFEMAMMDLLLLLTVFPRAHDATLRRSLSRVFSVLTTLSTRVLVR